MQSTGGLTGRELLDDWNRAKARGLTQKQHAVEIGLRYTTYTSRMQRAQAHFELEPAPELFNIDLGTPWDLRGDWCIVGDVHVPTTDYDLALLVATIAKRYLKGERRLLIAGDFFNFDAFSSYAQVVELPGVQQELAAGRHVLQVWLETFDEIYMLMGNHDRRLQKFTAGHLDNNDLVALLRTPERVYMSAFGYCTVDTDNGTWRITHPKNYSVNQLTVADALAQKHRQHIWSFHEHHFGMGWDRYGNNLIVNGGGLFEPAKMAYVSLDDSKSAGMKKGFGLLRDGYPYLFGDGLTDWSKWI